MEAAADLHAITAAKSASHYTCYRAALLSLSGNDAPMYRGFCERMLKSFADSAEPEEVHFTAWTCALAPNAVQDYTSAVTLARAAVKKVPGNRQYINGLGSILFRAGKFNEAKETLTRALAIVGTEATPTAYTYYFLALTEHEPGNLDAARNELLKANTAADNDLAASQQWNQRLTLRILRSEASEVIGEVAPEPEASEGDAEQSDASAR